MSKKITDTGELWVDERDNGRVRLGFTSAFLSQHQSECWHIIPTSGKIQKGSVLMSLETNDGLIPVASPVDGTIELFEEKAINYPEKLTVDTDIAEIRLEVIKPKSAADYLKKPAAQRASERNAQATAARGRPGARPRRERTPGGIEWVAGPVPAPTEDISLNATEQSRWDRIIQEQNQRLQEAIRNQPQPRNIVIDGLQRTGVGPDDIDW